MYGNTLDGQWSLRPDGALSRPLGLGEQLFYWVAVQGGNGDVIDFMTVNIQSRTSNEILFSKQNVIRAWTHLKLSYPLYGAQMEEQDGDIRFVVFEKDLHIVRPDELIFKQVTSSKEAYDLFMEIPTRAEANALHRTAQIYILTPADTTQQIHLIFHASHCITDMRSQGTMEKMFLDLIVNPRPFAYRIEDRLALSVASETLRPIWPKDSPRQRWRLAIAKVMIQGRFLQGGHILPRKMTTATSYSTPVTRSLVEVFSPEICTKLLAGCKKIGTTVGHVLPLLAQMAATRLLFRHYMQGRISKEEWEFRKRQPMHYMGLVNTRAMLDERWYQDGGKTHGSLALAPYSVTLPFMPLGSLSNTNPSPETCGEIPSFSRFLSMERFALRTQMVRKQFNRLTRDPLFFEKSELSGVVAVKRTRENATKWMEEQAKPEEVRMVGEDIPVMNSGFVVQFTNNKGVRDEFYPPKFPLGLKMGDEPILEVKDRKYRRFIGPASLYMSSETMQGTMDITVAWDANVYEEWIVKEFIGEVRSAAEWYLINGGKERGASEL